MSTKTKLKLKNNLFSQASLACLVSFIVFGGIAIAGWFYDIKSVENPMVEGENQETALPLILPADNTIRVTQSTNGIYYISVKRDSIEDQHIREGAVENDELARKSVDTYQLASGAVTKRVIADGAIDTRHLDDTIRIEKYLRVGDGSPSHFSLSEGDVYVSGKLEVDGDAYFDETIYVRDSSSISTMTSNTLQTTTANISNILSNSHLHIKGRLPNIDFLKIDDFVQVFINPSDGTIIGTDYDSIPTYQYIDGSGDLYVTDDLEVAGTIYGTISGAYSSSGNLDMDTNLITNIGNTGTDFTASGGLILAGDLALGANTLTTSNTTLISNLNADLLDGYHASSFQLALTNPVTGTGTGNYLSKWTGTTTQGDSIIYDNGTNVGIRTTSPQALLHLSASSGQGEGIMFTDTAASAGNKQMRIQFHPTPGGTSPAGIIFQQVNDDNSWGADLLTIRNNGNTGIGTNTPNYKLDVRGTIGTTGAITAPTASNTINNLVINAGALSNVASIAGSGALAISSGGTDQNITLTPSGTGYTILNGNIGIGTTSPGAKLHVEGDLFLGSTSGKRIYGGATATESDFSSFIELYNATDGSMTFDVGYSNADIKFNTQAGEVLRIDQNGNVGIGTTSPIQKLHVEGHCITGDSELTIVEDSTSNQEATFDVHRSLFTVHKIQIKDVQPGMKVLSFNEETNQLEPKTINKLLDMGVNPVFKLKTQSGKEITTTGNHPYLARLTDEQLKQRIQLREIGSLERDYGLSEGSLSIDQEFSQVRDVWADQSDQASSDVHPSQHSGGQREIQPQGVHPIPLQRPGQSLRSGRLSQGSRGTGISDQSADQGSDYQSAQDSGNDWRTDQLSEEKLWSKVIYLQAGDQIAVCEQSSVNCGQVVWDKIVSIEYVGKEQVYDIEVEGTHNFVANGILAHNTYISGNVGIGTTSPSYPLAVSGGVLSSWGGITAQLSNADSETGLQLLNTATGGRGYALFSTSNLSALGGGKFVIADWTGQAARLTIDSSGNVGIGTVSPGAKLEVNGQILSDSRITAQYTSALKDLLILRTNNLFRTSGQQVGIAFKLPRYTSSDTTPYEMASIWAETADSTHGSQAALLRMTTRQSDGTTNAGIALDSSGNVGIGTTSPGAKLHIDGDLYIERGNSINFYASGLGRKAGISATNSSPYNELQFFVSDEVEAMRIDNDGNVGIGTTEPVRKLQVVASDLGADFKVDLATAATNGRAFSISATGESYARTEFYSNSFLGFGSGSATRDTFIGRSAANTIRIGSSYDGSGTGHLIVNGNVGIGTTSPSELLSLYAGTGSKSILLNTAGGNSNASLKLQNDAQTWETGVFGSSNDRYEIRNTAKIPFSIEPSADTDSLAIQADGDVIMNGGNVGIGTTAPNRKLFVNGDAGGTTAWYNDSDERLKKDIETIPNALNTVLSLRGVQFRWKDQESHSPGEQIGFIAQETLSILPQVVSRAGEYYGMQYAPITALLVEGIKQQHEMIISNQLSIKDLGSEDISVQEKISLIGTSLQELDSQLSLQTEEIAQNREEIEELNENITSLVSLSDITSSLLSDHETRIQNLENIINDITVAETPIDLSEQLKAWQDNLQYLTDENGKLKFRIDGDFEVEGNLRIKDEMFIENEGGVIMKSAGGKCFNVSIDDEGVLQSEEMECLSD